MATVEYGARPHDRGYNSNKYFRKQAESYAQQLMTGYPDADNTKDTIFSATQSLREGDWKTCTDLILGLRSWNLFLNPQEVKKIISKRIKDEALRTYLLTYSSNFDSIKLDRLSELFEMEKNSIHSIVSKMIINEDFKASWDQPTDSLVLHRKEPSHLQLLALQFADKVGQLVHYNENMLNNGLHGENKNRDRDGYRGNNQANKDGASSYRGGRGGRARGRGGGQGRRYNRGGFRPNTSY